MKAIPVGRLADHLLMAQPMQQPGQQDSEMMEAIDAGSKAAEAANEGATTAAQPAAGPPVGKHEQAQGNAREAGEAAGTAPEAADVKPMAAARVFLPVHQPASATKAANPHLGPLDRRKRQWEALDVEVLAGGSLCCRSGCRYHL